MTYLLKNALLLDAEHDHAPLDILIVGETIAAIGTDLGSAEQILDLTGYTILPGFVDAHVHVAVDDHAFKEDAVRAWVYNGVTTVRELGMLSTLSQQDYAQWLLENNKKPDTAHVVATGKYIDVAGGYGAGPMPNHPVGNLITAPEEAADAVTLAHELGYPGIKIGIHDGSMDQTPHLTPEMAKAICDRAHALHMWVAAHIGNCKGPCVGLQGEEDYRRSVGMVASLLRGDTRDTMRYLKEKMSEASDAMRFEEAAQYKKRIEILTSYQSKSVVVSNTLTNMDVFSLVTDEDAAFCNFMRIADGAVVNSFTVELKPGLEDTPRDVLTYAIGTIAERLSGKLSREVIVPFPPSGSLWENVAFTVPQRGDKLRLLELSERNARLYRLEKLKQIEIKDPARHTNRILSTLQRELRLSVPPRHIECFDNSNLQGTNPVASCVVFRDGKPSRKEYRHFNIKTVVGANDFASMEEVIGRRYSRLLAEGAELPELIVVDGGKGQLRFAYETLQRLGLEHKIAIVGLAKRIEEVYFPHDPLPYYIDRNSEALKVLMHIRDEAHRFGITFHRKKRSLAFIRSELESIPTLGPRSVDKLLRHYRTVSNIRRASEEELSGLIGRQRAAEVIWYYAGRNILPAPSAEETDESSPGERTSAASETLRDGTGRHTPIPEGNDPLPR